MADGGTDGWGPRLLLLLMTLLLFGGLTFLGRQAVPRGRLLYHRPLISD